MYHTTKNIAEATGKLIADVKAGEYAAAETIDAALEAVGGINALRAGGLSFAAAPGDESEYAEVDHLFGTRDAKGLAEFVETRQGYAAAAPGEDAAAMNPVVAYAIKRLAALLLTLLIGA